MKLIIYFDNHHAEYRYRLDGDLGFYYGDLNWAKKIARHYNLEVPPTPEV